MADLDGNDAAVVHLLRDWRSGSQMRFKSSGSSGPPREFLLSRDLILWSIRNTAKAVHTGAENALLAIPASRIGGAMLVLRSFVLNWDLQVVEPSRDPMRSISSDHEFTITSIVPAQLYRILDHSESLQKLLRFKRVLIGGEPIRPDRERFLLSAVQNDGPWIYHTYGMTETASHIALRKLGEPFYTPFDGVSVDIDAEQDLGIHIPHLDLHFRTGDRAELLGEGKFRILGRNRFVVNSAGLKIPIEETEVFFLEILQPRIEEFIALWKEEDRELGERLILITNMPITSSDEKLRERVDHYLIPKKYYFLDEPIYTESGKPDRIAMHLKVLSQNQK